MVEEKGQGSSNRPAAARPFAIGSSVDILACQVQAEIESQAEELTL
jgi:hypothetical protein